MRRYFVLVLLAVLAVPAVVQAQAAEPFDLSIKNIMRGPELYGREPSQIRWTPDGQWIYFNWLPAGSPWNATTKPFRVAPRAGAVPEEVTAAHMDSIAPWLANGPKSRDGRFRVVAANGDLWLHQIASARSGATRVTLRRLTETQATESNPKFSADGKLVYFVRENNVYSMDIATGLIRQLTDIRSAGGAGAAAGGPGGFGGGLGGGGFGGGQGGGQGGQGGQAGPPQGRGAQQGPTQRGSLAQQMTDLFDVIRDRARADSIARAERQEREGRALPVVNLPANERLMGISISPDGKSALLTTTIPPAQAAKGADVPNYITADGYPAMIPGRSKVGDVQAMSRAAHLEIATGKLTWLTIAPDNQRARPALGNWSDDGRFALLYATAMDNKTRWIYAVASTGGTMVTLDTQRDSAWIGGPCIGGGFGGQACSGWLPDGRAYFGSEATGYAHLYVVNADGTGKTALTSGNWEVLSAELAEDGKSFVLHTSEISPFTRQAYRMAVTGGARTRITQGEGGHTATVAPDGRTYATVYSEANKPWELYVAQVGRTGMTQLTTSTSEEFRRYAWKVPPIVMIPGEDGTPVPARIYRPTDHGAQANGGAVIFVHGAGYLHNVHNWWSQYAREYMFNHMLATKGYTVLDIDYRGSAGYGRDWRTAIYRHMGGWDINDHVSGSKYLTREFGINPERIGLYGGSYGGFTTLMALFTKAEYFGAGAALRSVTDWASYNHGYTANILNEPQNDREAYRRSSPIFFAEGLQDPLLMAHGMVDTNVQFQDIVMLTQRLIELGKPDWELAVYPVENHGFERPDSWTDEYRRIFELFERTIGPNGSKVRR